jgi:hypothetical protein
MCGEGPSPALRAPSPILLSQNRGGQRGNREGDEVEIVLSWWLKGKYFSNFSCP